MDTPLGRRLTKSSIMVGLGETDDEVVETMSDLRSAGVDVLTIGQYLRPSPKHHEVVRFVVTPATPDVISIPLAAIVAEAPRAPRSTRRSTPGAAQRWSAARCPRPCCCTRTR